MPDMNDPWGAPQGIGAAHFPDQVTDPSGDRWSAASGPRSPSPEGPESISIDTGFTSVTISLPVARLKALGAVSSAIEVAPLTSILPVPSAGDPDPQSPEEIAQAIGPMRRLAAEIFERS